MNIFLEKPNIKRKVSYLRLIDEFKEANEPLVPWVIGLDTSDFGGLLKKFEEEEKGIGLNENQVPHATFWLIVDEEVVGVSNLRLKLNENLLHCGGHIGYGVKPSARKKGFATKMLAETLIKARGYGISDCLVTCDKSNTASAKTIINNDGVFDSEEFLEDRGEVIQRYWIKS